MSNLIFDGADWILIDIGYDETVDEIVEMIRLLDFPLAKCQAIVATHADADHIQGLARAKQIFEDGSVGSSACGAALGRRRQAQDLC